MTLDKWFNIERKLLEDFTIHWLKMNSLDERNYPLEMAAGEWDEQILAFERAHPVKERQ